MDQFGAAAGWHYVSSRLCESLRERKANAAGAADDDGGLFGQIELRMSHRE